MKHGTKWLVLIVALALTLGCSSESEDELLVFAAASLAEAMREIETSFEFETGIEVELSLGGSQWLAQQIASGAPADLFISAGDQPIRFLTERNLVDGEPIALLTNRLVVVVDSEGAVPITSLEDLKDPGIERIAIADPILAPAGLYAKQALTSLDVWSAIEDKLVFGGDVRATMAYVETGNADAALVYVTDAAQAADLPIADVVPPESHAPILYPAAIIDAPHTAARVSEFVGFLGREAAASIFRRYGFEPVE